MVDSNTKAYAVVEFPKEKHNGNTPLAVVPTNWIMNKNNKTVCKWPNNVQNDKAFTKLVISREIFSEEDDHILCDINIKYRTDDYTKAVSKLKLLECDSNLSASASSEEAFSKRKCIPNSRYANDVFISQKQYQTDSDSGETLPQIPMAQVKCSDTKKQKKHLNKRRTCLLDSESSDKEDDCTLVESPEPQPKITFLELFKAVNRMEGLMKSTITKVMKLEESIQFLTKLIVQKDKDKESPELEVISELPLKSEGDLTSFNDMLKAGKDFAACCSTLKVIGGKDGTETVRKVLDKMISHEFSLLINWSGRNDKVAFSIFGNIIQLITAVARMNPLSANMTSAEVENTIKHWLRTAPDRKGGRDRRRRSCIDNK